MDVGVSRESSAMPDNNFIIRRHRCHNELPLQAASMLEASTFATRRATRRLSAGDLIQCSTTETLLHLTRLRQESGWLEQRVLLLAIPDDYCSSALQS